MELLHQIPIKEFMTKEVVVLLSDETMAEAYQKMKDHRIRHLPVVDKQGLLIGIFTEKDLNRAYLPRETDSGWYYDKEELNLCILQHFMTKDPLTLTPEGTLKDAAQIMARNKFGCIPIVLPETKQLVGIISYIDILKKIASLF